MTIYLGDTPVLPPEQPVFVEPDQDRAVELFHACWECLKEIAFLDRRLDKRVAWRDRNRHLEGTELFMDREGMIHDDFATKHGAWRRLVKASAALQRELERWPPKDRERWCGAWGIDYPCEVFSYQVETSLDGTPFWNVAPF